MQDIWFAVQTPHIGMGITRESVGLLDNFDFPTVVGAQIGIHKPPEGAVGREGFG